MAAFLATFTNPEGVTKQLRVTVRTTLVSAKRDLRRRGILARSIVSAHGQIPPPLAAKGKPGHGLQLDHRQVFEASLQQFGKALFAKQSSRFA